MKATLICCHYMQPLRKAQLLNNSVDTLGIFLHFKFVFSEVQFNVSLWSLSLVLEVKKQNESSGFKAHSEECFFSPFPFPSPLSSLAAPLLFPTSALRKFSKSFQSKCWITSWKAQLQNSVTHTMLMWQQNTRYSQDSFSLHFFCMFYTIALYFLFPSFYLMYI